MSSIEGTLGNDILEATWGKDTVLAKAGDDQVRGLGGDDVILLDRGDDLGFGGDGDDTIYGGDGNDLIDGEDGDDTVNGGAGDDRLSGGAGNDVVLGRDGQDNLRGGLGDDELRGGQGDDYLDAGGGTNMLSGGAGNDVLFIYGSDQAAAGDGDDLVSFYGYATLYATVALGVGADRLTLDVAGDSRAFPGGAKVLVTDFEQGVDRIGGLSFVFTDDDGAALVDFAALDSSRDGMIDVGDAGVTIGVDGLTIDLAPALTGLGSVGRPDFHVDAPITLTFSGLASLSSEDFIA